METTRALMPRARQDELVVEELQDETLVYDLKRHKARCLNRTAALVWRCCDGQTSVAEVAALLGEQSAIPTDEAVVWMALDRLSRADLLSEPVTLPADRAQYSRRQMLRIPATGSRDLAPPAGDRIDRLATCGGTRLVCYFGRLPGHFTTLLRGADLQRSR